MPTQKEQYWREVIQGFDPLQTPGTYVGIQSLTIDEFGRITGITTSGVNPTSYDVKYQQAEIDNLGQFQFIGNSIGTTDIIKRVSVTITTGYTAGVTITIEDVGGAEIMSSSLINAQVPGTYRLDLDSNVTAIGNNNRVRANILNAPSAAGAGVVWYEYYLPA